MLKISCKILEHHDRSWTLASRDKNYMKKWMHWKIRRQDTPWQLEHFEKLGWVKEVKSHILQHVHLGSPWKACVWEMAMVTCPMPIPGAVTRGGRGRWGYSPPDWFWKIFIKHNQKTIFFNEVDEIRGPFKNRYMLVSEGCKFCKILLHVDD